MVERLHFLVVYVGSAAIVAFLAVCLTSPRIATFTCGASSPNDKEQCQLAETLAVAAEGADASLAYDAADARDAAPARIAAAH